MDGQPAYWPDDESFGIISVDSAGKWDGIPFFRGRKNGVNFEYDIESRGMKVYAYPPAHIDREEWTAEWIPQMDDDGCCWAQCSRCGHDLDSMEEPSAFCPACGSAMTPEAWAMLEKRLNGGERA